MPDLVVRSRRVVLPTGETAADVVVVDGRIAAVEPHGSTDAREIVDAGELVVSPGLVDAHVHVNQPGRTHWEGFTTATRAAAAGGVTTVVDMPLNSIPPTIDVPALEAKRGEAASESWVDVAFWGGLVPGSEDHLRSLAEAGVCGFKAFLVDSGVPEFPPVDEALLRRGMETLAPMGLPLIVHAELWEPMAEAQRRFERLESRDRRHYRSYLASRPPTAEDAAVELVVRTAEETGARVHVLHLASGSAVAILAAARERGVAVTAETCPHYLTFAAEEIDDGATAFKCAPPIREAWHREALWDALAEGTVDMVVSDHSPAPAEDKGLDHGDFALAWGGIASLQLRLPATWSEARRRGFGTAHLAAWLSDAPARLAGLEHRKGRVARGLDADLVVWDPEGRFEVDPTQLEHRHPVSPYAGRMLEGVVRTTILRGELIYDDGDLAGPRGSLLRRGA